MPIITVVFKIADDEGYPDRYSDLFQALKPFATSGVWWSDAASLILFDCNSNVDHVAEACKAAVDVRRDFVLVMIGVEQGAAIGRYDEALLRVTSRIRPT